MKALCLAFTAFTAIALHAQLYHASAICQMAHRYSFDGLARDEADRQTFVICEETCSAAPRLTRALKVQPLSVRLSGEAPVLQPGAKIRIDRREATP